MTGLGVVSSIGISKDEFWPNLLAGKSGISKVEAFDTTQHFTHNGGEVKNFRPELYLAKSKIKLMGRTSHFAIAAVKLALKDAGLDASDFKNLKAAVCLGTTGGEAQEMEKIDAVWLKQGRDKVEIQTVIQYPVNNIPSNVAFELRIKGQNTIFTTACAAGNYAIGYGFDLLEGGKVDMAIVGGADAFSYASFTGFNQVGAVAPEKCQPFDKNRKGMMVGEGAGILILERLEDALARGAEIYAEIVGYGLSCDASHMTNPNPEGVAQCIRKALKNTSLTADDIDYISAHGTGTRNNDKAECAAIKDVFAGRAKQVPVSSIKSMLGHTMGAASAIEAITCCLAIKNDIVPPTINYETPDPECDIDCVPNKAREIPVNVVLNNGFAFGGNNSCLVLRKYEREE